MAILDTVKTIADLAKKGMTVELQEIMLDSFDSNVSEKMRYVFDVVRSAAGLAPKPSGNS